MPGPANCMWGRVAVRPMLMVGDFTRAMTPRTPERRPGITLDESLTSVWEKHVRGHPWFSPPRLNAVNQHFSAPKK